MVAAAIQERPVESSMADTVWYDKAQEAMFVQYKKGGVYRYQPVPLETFDRLTRAVSFGKAMKTEVIPRRCSSTFCIPGRTASRTSKATRRGCPC